MANAFAKSVQGEVDGTPLPSLLANAGGTPIGTLTAPVVATPLSTTVVTDGVVAAGRLWVDSGGNLTMPSMGLYGSWNSKYYLFPNQLRGTMVGSGAQTSTFNVGFATTQFTRGVVVTLDVTVVTGTAPTLTMALQYQDAASGKWVTIPGAITAVVNSVSTVTLAVYPGIVAAANQSVSWPTPAVMRLLFTIGGTTPSFTMSAGYDTIP